MTRLDKTINEFICIFLVLFDNSVVHFVYIYVYKTIYKDHIKYEYFSNAHFRPLATIRRHFTMSIGQLMTPYDIEVIALVAITALVVMLAIIWSKNDRIAIRQLMAPYDIEVIALVAFTALVVMLAIIWSKHDRIAIGQLMTPYDIEVIALVAFTAIVVMLAIIWSKNDRIAFQDKRIANFQIICKRHRETNASLNARIMDMQQQIPRVEGDSSDNSPTAHPHRECRHQRTRCCVFPPPAPDIEYRPLCIFAFE